MNSYQYMQDHIRLFVNQDTFCLIDYSAYDLIRPFNWTLQKRYGKRVGHPEYVKAHLGNRKYTLLHRFLVSAPLGLQVDHVNHNSLDNRLCNLRFCTNSENVANQSIRADNTSGIKGVYPNFRSKRKPWTARATQNGRTCFEKSFATKEEAARAYKEQACQLFGEFANPEHK
jgi:hypothetical protein